MFIGLIKQAHYSYDGVRYGKCNLKYFNVTLLTILLLLQLNVHLSPLGGLSQNKYSSESYGCSKCEISVNKRNFDLRLSGYWKETRFLDLIYIIIICYSIFWGKKQLLFFNHMRFIEIQFNDWIWQTGSLLLKPSE